MKKYVEAGALLILIALLSVEVKQMSSETADISDFSYHVAEEHITIPGLEREYRFAVVNDIHIIVENDEIPEEQLQAVQEREKLFTNDKGETSAEMWLNLAEEIGEYSPDAVLLGGDILDYISTSNVECFEEGQGKIDAPFMYVRADHDISPYYSDLKQEQINELESSIDSNEDVFVMDYKDFLIVGINNSTSQMSAEAVGKVEELFAAGKPVIL